MWALPTQVCDIPGRTWIRGLGTVAELPGAAGWEWQLLDKFWEQFWTLPGDLVFILCARMWDMVFFNGVCLVGSSSPKGNCS